MTNKELYELTKYLFESWERCADYNNYHMDCQFVLEALAEQPAQQEPVAFSTRRSVEREIERTANPTGMRLNDGKERVTLPEGTLRHMLALIDRTSPPAQRKPLTDEEIERCMKQAYATVQGRNLEHAFARAIEAKLREKNT